VSADAGRPADDRPAERRLADDRLADDRLADDRRWLARAVELARHCPPSSSAFSVGAVVVGADGRELASGYSRAGDPRDHAEEYALRRLPAGLDLAGATVYSSLEPCGARASRPRTCAELIIAAGVRRVVFAWREPAVFVNRQGAEILTAAGVEVVELPEFAAAARAVNEHLPRPPEPGGDGSPGMDRDDPGRPPTGAGDDRQ
jgi:pyrimidine deaminase RibD-like protein